MIRDANWSHDNLLLFKMTLYLFTSLSNTLCFLFSLKDPLLFVKAYRRLTAYGPIMMTLETSNHKKDNQLEDLQRQIGKMQLQGDSAVKSAESAKSNVAAKHSVEEIVNL